MFNVPEKMKLNKYVSCSIPRNKDLFTRVGARLPRPSSDDVLVADYCSRKLDDLGRSMDLLTYEQYSAAMQQLQQQQQNDSAAETDETD